MAQQERLKFRDRTESQDAQIYLVIFRYYFCFVYHVLGTIYKDPSSDTFSSVQKWSKQYWLNIFKLLIFILTGQITNYKDILNLYLIINIYYKNKI